MTVKNMADLRNLLAEVMTDVRTSSTPDLARTRAFCEVATVMVNAIRTQVAYASIIKGDLELPFMEEPVVNPERPHSVDSVTDPMTRTAQLLTAGPSPEHPWRQRLTRWDERSKDSFSRR